MSSGTTTTAQPKKKEMNLTTKILVYMLAGLVAGMAINTFAHDSAFVNEYVVGGFFNIVGKMFVQALKMLVVPLVFFSLIQGIVGMDDLKTIGRTGGKAFALFLATTIIAISLGLFTAVSLGIGQGFDLSASGAAGFTAKQAPSFSEVIIGFVPDNIIGAMASGEMLQIIVASMFIGIAIIKSGEHGKKVSNLVEDINHTMMNLVHIVMSLAPYGVFCLIAKTFAEQGIALIVPMLSYFLTVAGVLVAHFVCTFSIMFALAGLNPLIFMQKMRSTLLFAFSTASSNATIPVTMEAAETRLGVDNSIASFVIPLGATVNMNGTAIMQGVATVFIANAYGIALGPVQYMVVIGMSVLASIGTAGVPGVGLVMLALVFGQVGLPVEGIALIIGVDRLLDMMRTAVNVTGDAATACIVAKSEGKLDLKMYKDPNAGNIAAGIHEHEDDVKIAEVPASKKKAKPAAELKRAA